MSSAMSLAQCALGQFQYVNDEAGTLADSTCTAHCNNRDFGTSRWQISMNATRTCCGAGGRSWPLADALAVRLHVRFRGRSGHYAPVAPRQLMPQSGHRSWLKAAIDRLSNRFGSTCDLADSAKWDAALGLLTLGISISLIYPSVFRFPVVHFSASRTAQ